MAGQVFINEIVKASFNLCQPKSKRPINIYLIVRINQKQAKLSTGVKVYPGITIFQFLSGEFGKLHDGLDGDIGGFHVTSDFHYIFRN